MKILTNIIFLSALFTTQAMHKPISVYFNNDDVHAMHDALMLELANAQDQILVAGSWIVEPALVSELIRLKKEKPSLDIQVFFEYTAPQLLSVLTDLDNNNIPAMVFVSETDEHLLSKFTIVDDNFVLSGQANCNSGQAYSDNTVETLIRIQPIVNQYRDHFFQLKDESIKRALDALLELHKTNFAYYDFIAWLLGSLANKKDRNLELLRLTYAKALSNKHILDKIIAYSQTLVAPLKSPWPLERFIKKPQSTPQSPQRLNKKRKAPELITPNQKHMIENLSPAQKDYFASQGYDLSDLITMNKADAERIISKSFFIEKE